MFVMRTIALTVCFGLSGVASCISAYNSEESSVDGGELDTSSDAADAPNDEALLALYQAAVRDAVFADSDEIADDLIAVTSDDDRVTWMGEGDAARVAVVTWTSYPDSYPPGETVTNSWGDLWVTVSPELKERMRDFDDTSSLRVAELLGLPPSAENSHFATLWVKPADLFRPAPDNEITDHTCGLSLPDTAEDGYVDWYEHNIFTSYFPPAYPWTRLGYTYDWAPNASEQGLSEFVVKQGSSLIVESLKTTQAYLLES